MARVDWSETPRFHLKPGIYLAEVAKAEEKLSKKGEAYFRLALVAVEWNRAALCDDILMLEGKGRGVGTGKLEMLGVPKGTSQVDAVSLIGKRVYCYVDIETREYEGKTHENLKVDIKKGQRCGYWPEVAAVESLKPSAESPAPVTKPMDDEDLTPF